MTTHMVKRYDTTHTPTLGAFHMDTTANRLVMGPVGSGKSVCMVMDMFMKACNQRPDQNGVRRTRMLVVRNTTPQLKMTTILTFQHWIPQSVCPIVMSPPIRGIMRFPHRDGKTTVDCEVFFLALDRAEDRVKLLSFEPTMIWFNEAREIPFGLVSAAAERVAGTGRYPPQSEGGASFTGMIFDTNMPSKASWIYRLAEKQKPSNWSFRTQPGGLLRARDDSGVYLPNPAAENLPALGGHRYYFDMLETKLELDPGSIPIQILSQYGQLKTGRPVFEFSFNEGVHVSSVAMEPVPGNRILVGWDFGSTPAVVIGQHIRGVLRLYHEVTGTRAGGAPELWTAYVQPLLNEHFPGYRCLHVGDPAGMQATDLGPSVIDTMRKDHRVNIVPAVTNRIPPRLEAVRGFLGKMVGGLAAFQIHPRMESCIAALGGDYQWEKRGTGSSERYTDKPEKLEPSHAMDCLQYIAMEAGRMGASDKRQGTFTQGKGGIYVPATHAGY